MIQELDFATHLAQALTWLNKLNNSSLVIIGTVLVVYDVLYRSHRDDLIFKESISDLFNKWRYILIAVIGSFLLLDHIISSIVMETALLSLLFFYSFYALAHSKGMVQKWSGIPYNRVFPLGVTLLLTLLYFQPAQIILIDGIKGPVASVYSVIESNPLGVAAALFAYLGWKYNTLDTRSDKESEFAVHFENQQSVSLDQVKNRKSPEYVVDNIQISERDGLLYALRRYLPLSSFQGQAVLTVRQEELQNLSENEVFIAATQLVYIHDISKSSKERVTITFNSCNIKTVRKALELLVLHLDGRPSAGSPSYEENSVGTGRLVPGKVEYYKPKGVIRMLLFASEISDIRMLVKADSVGVMTRRQSERPGIGLLYHHENEWVRSFDRNFLYTLHFLFGMTKGFYQPVSAYKPSYRGAQRLRKMYVDISIRGTSLTVSEDGDDLHVLNVEVDPSQDSRGICHMIPLSEFSLDYFDPLYARNSVMRRSLFSHENIDKIWEANFTPNTIITENCQISVLCSCIIEGEEYILNLNFSTYGFVVIFEMYPERTAGEPNSGVLWTKKRSHS